MRRLATAADAVANVLHRRQNGRGRCARGTSQAAAHCLKNGRKTECEAIAKLNQLATPA